MREPAGIPLATRVVLHLIPAAVLFMCLLPVVMVVDVVWPAKTHKGTGAGGDDDADVDKHPHIKIVFDEGKPPEKDHDYHDSMNFAVHKIDPRDKNAPSVKLNWYDNGFGNSIVAQIDGKDAVFGDAGISGKWYRDDKVDYTKGGLPAGKYGGKRRTYDFQREGILITQTVTIEPGDPVPVGPNDYQRFLTTCLVRYKIHNADGQSHRVGLRVLMDTCIGKNDGVPFILPGVDELVTTFKDFRAPNIPDFVQVVGRPDRDAFEKVELNDPANVVLQLNLRVSDKFEAPERFLLTRYPGREGKVHNKWQIPVRNLDGDSAVVIYWEPRELKKGASREVGFTYGLGNVTVKGKLGLTVGGSTYVDGELTVVALVTDRDAKWATLELPEGMKLMEGKQALRQPVPPVRDDRPSPVTWKIRSTSPGRHNVAVTTDSGLAASRRVTITAKSLFN